MTPLPDNPAKAETAAWMGYGDDVAAMDARHDPLHVDLASWVGIPSFSLRIASGEALSGPERVLAGLEEDAVLCLQRYLQHVRVYEQTRPLKVDEMRIDWALIAKELRAERAREVADAQPTPGVYGPGQGEEV